MFNKHSSTYRSTTISVKPTRENSFFDLIFTTNPSYIKSTANNSTISDHEIVVADSYTKPYYIEQKPRRCFTFSKVNWDQLKAELTYVSKQLYKSNVHHLWDTFKSKLSSGIQSNI
ncbi:hypothetical protein DPMN_033917 [Dreissena polymorpha]|uniref:Uncharacterized protein n=1 Tax=Dreissena polymorpha TaxID=45954 RepID=A0A9D4M4N8_DREPO|nr:hypothetical protein DPMN_033917 [Dreissena polymorpha]